MIVRFGVIWILVFMFLSCQHKKDTFREHVKKWEGKTIVFPCDMEAKVLGRDTFAYDLLEKKIKLLVYIDSAGCTPCKMHLYQWSQVIKENRKYTDNLAFIFVVHTDNPKKIDIICEQNQFDYPVFYDSGGKMEQLNHLPRDASFQTFLLENDKVKLIGDPLVYPKLMDLYMEVINEACK